MRRRALWRILGVALVLAGCLAPRGWYDALPRSAELPVPPIRGVTLLQVALVLEGLALLWVSLGRWSWGRLDPADRLAGRDGEASPAAGGRDPLYLLAAITLLGLVLRLIDLGSDLWLDEIVTVRASAGSPFLHLLASYTSSNNHLLNSVLVKLAVAWVGPEEWAIRLPAVLFGVASIPALYWVARLAFTRRASLVAALLLAVSYHHVFYSQSARGYTAHLFFSLLASALLVKGLEGDRARDWGLYVAAMAGNFASMLHASFVWGGHALVGAAAAIAVRGRGGDPQPLLRRLLLVFGAVGILGFQLYALILPQAYVISRVVYTDPSVGFALGSSEFLQELERGLGAGLGEWTGVGVTVAGILAGAGFLILLRRRWALAAALSLPLVSIAAFSLLSGVFVSPRLFILGLPLAILGVVQALFSGAELVSRRLGTSRTSLAPRLATALALTGCVVPLSALGDYYAVPKQSYRSAIEYAESRTEAGALVIVVHLARGGYLHYGPQSGLREDQDWYFVDSLADLEATLAEHPGRPRLLVTTFPRALRLSRPQLAERISRDWVPARTFPATIGDGEISVWRERGTLSP